MGSISLQNVSKVFGEAKVIPSIDLDINDGEFVVFVGPSGCGKSTLLRLIAGLEDVSGGKIVIDGKDVTERAPAERGLAMVFQSYALYPHMSVRNNIAFPLKMAKLDKAVIDRKVEDAARVLNLTDYLERRPSQLSGGQRQRVAIGRAIVREPSAFLFDEPLSNLDAALRGTMRLEISELHNTLKTTMIYVTHDQVEAMTMADKIVVLNRGNIEQVGSPMELYRSPANLFVADFIGSPRMNLITGDFARQRVPPQPGFGRNIWCCRRKAVSGRARSPSPNISAPTHFCISMSQASARLPPARTANSPASTATLSSSRPTIPKSTGSMTRARQSRRGWP